jgi:non-heme chloroperoxidase
LNRSHDAVTKEKTVQHLTFDGGAGVKINVVETGNPDGPPILFIHGWSQSHASWFRQLNAPELSERFRLIALDLRGPDQTRSTVSSLGAARARNSLFEP